MAPTPASSRSKNPPPSKLSKLPQNAKITKTPLARRPIPSPLAGPSSPKIVYVSGRTPFMSAVKRIRSLLHSAEARRTQSLRANPPSGCTGDKILDRALSELDTPTRREEVRVAGGGRSVEKVLALARFFEERSGEERVVVRLKTGTVGTIDWIEYEGDGDGAGEEVEREESRLRGVSVLEAVIALK
ncbi:hypothetical protein EJ06DRAFT_558888 [Trichodelitschia bisporula]|uniref:Uncharacterized protein n=1 Tax=Trichodelitschia bisporula TaxID=703511 RepID=A0A6G1HN85_9PEZI|nr:hypothetical protein EJ06DRAFT_558888 [Trichodelitschia bisporula]